jgi:bifunctional UDP-N-acetylglucosamine pyrophosphorylase / glucosamine-1-phosphate N-acetyltransferase
MKNDAAVIILAGGRGTRMKSGHPKVLADFLGEPIITRILRAVTPICEHPSIVVGYRGEEVVAATGNRYRYIEQKEQLGTGHAVGQAKRELEHESASCIAVLNGDHPLITGDTVRRLVESHTASGANITITTVRVPSFEGDNKVLFGYGRVLRDAGGGVIGVKELKDATPAERTITEVNCGYYCFRPEWLWKNIEALENKNEAKEYYLTDLVGVAAKQGERINACELRSYAEAMGVNTPEELQIAERCAGEQGTG